METKTSQKPDRNPGASGKKSAFCSVLDVAEQIVICLCVVLVLFCFLLRVCVVSGSSMLPTLRNGQILLVSDLFYQPHAGDIVVFHQTSENIALYNEPIVKRVIATEGQTVTIRLTPDEYVTNNRTYTGKKGEIFVDGVLLEETYIQLIDRWSGTEIGLYQSQAIPEYNLLTDEDGVQTFEITLPEGMLFVMGDNRNNSADSRTVAIGPVDRRRVLGRVIVQLPLTLPKSAN